MSQEIGAAEATLALEAIERRRREVMAEIDVPAWYWATLAGGWAGVGAVAQYGPAWATTLATAAFGAAHATIAPRVLSGRNASPQLSVRQELVSHRIPLYVIGFLITMMAGTVGTALWLHADGARHSALGAGLVVGALVLTGGPTLMAAIRRRTSAS